MLLGACETEDSRVFFVLSAYRAHTIQLFAAILKECVRQITNL